AVLQALEERHLFVYLPDAGPAGDAIHAAGWDGALREGAGDYLMVVDANLGFNKASPYVTEALSYTVDLRDIGRPQAELIIEHAHTVPAGAIVCDHTPRYDLTYEQMMRRCYWDYVRVYAPEGSQLLEATRHPVPGELLVTGLGRDGDAEVLSGEVDKTTFATLLVLAPGERVETRFVYDLPPGTVNQEGDVWRYSLTIQKQGGAGEHKVSVTLILPPGAEVISSSPPPSARAGSTLSYELSSRTDVELKVRLQVP
ncbi:MAG: hypothetical protein JXD18_10580, partial [Anaerolineae bacterium]|nr:hypothetical protein [Anaerolineae bacterium]